MTIAFRGPSDLDMQMRWSQIVGAVIAAAGCGSGGESPDGGGAPDARGADAAPDARGADAAPAETVTCPDDCTVIEPPEPGWPGDLSGTEDPWLVRIPDEDYELLAYSYRWSLGAPSDGTVLVPLATSHLATVTDLGAAYFAISWGGGWTVDPEVGSGPEGNMTGASPSLVHATTGGDTTWYGAHVAYYQPPTASYAPALATSWRVMVSTGPTFQLSQADEAALGVATTAAAYEPAARLDQLAGLAAGDCATIANPALFADAGQLYLAVDCLAWDGAIGDAPDLARSTTQLYATTPTGPVADWTWRHVGVLVDAAGAGGLGPLRDAQIVRTGAGTLIAVLTRVELDPARPLGVVGAGCVALELTSIDPPVIRRDTAGAPLVRATATGDIGQCSYSGGPGFGILGTNRDRVLVDTTLRP